MRSLLLTGFEPFDGAAVNSSWELARSLEGEVIAGLRVAAVCLPCRFDHSLPALDAALRRLRPAAVVALGQAGARSCLSFERVAINWIDARIADNAGLQPIDEAVHPGAPPAYFTRLPVKAMVAASEAAGVPAELSFSAGSFVCNQVFFGLMHRLRRRPALPAGFVHVPALGPDTALSELRRGLRAALAAIDTPELHMARGVID